jgi:hypothetical protein
MSIGEKPMRKAIFIAAVTAVTAISAIPAAAQYYYGEPPPLVVGPPVPYWYPSYYPPAGAEPRPYYRATGQPDPYLSGTRGRMNQGASPVYPEGPGNARTR